MGGLQAHLEGPPGGTRERGMAAGQSLVNLLHCSVQHRLELPLQTEGEEGVMDILRLARWEPVCCTAAGLEGIKRNVDV